MGLAYRRIVNSYFRQRLAKLVGSKRSVTLMHIAYPGASKEVLTGLL
jgi:hypothetical protein